MLGRHGLYVREWDVWIVFLFFKGTDIHSGSHPTYTPASMESWARDQQALNVMWETSVNRVALVCYPTASLFSRIAPMSTSPPLHFLNGAGSVPAAHKVNQLNFAQHSRGILGNSDDFHNRMARDGVYAFANHLIHSGVHMEGGISELMQKMWYLDDGGSKKYITPPPIDLDSNLDYVTRMRGYWSWHEEVSHAYRIRMTKFAYATEQERQAQENVTSGAYTEMENPRSVLLPQIPSVQDQNVIVTKILSRQKKDRDVSAEACDKYKFANLGS